jgi:antitoxin PrlF
MSATVVLGKQGRLVVPAELRAQLGLEPGDQLNLRVDNGELVLSRRADALAQLRGLLSAIPQDRDLVEELIAERRLEASRE